MRVVTLIGAAVSLIPLLIVAQDAPAPFELQVDTRLVVQTVSVMGKDGKMEKYWFEMSNLSNMVSRGIKKTTFKAGDKVTVTYHPLKDGRKGGNYTSIVAADGHHYE